MTTTAPPVWRDQIASLRYLAVKVARVHGDTHPSMGTLAEVVATLADSQPDDHAAHVALAHRLRELTWDFHPWNGSCHSVRLLFSGLAAVAAVLPITVEQP
jgi:iron-sulfur cluster repair protein YtfE (RIC family)